MRSTKKYSKRKPYGRTKKNRRVRRYRGGEPTDSIPVKVTIGGEEITFDVKQVSKNPISTGAAAEAEAARLRAEEEAKQRAAAESARLRDEDARLSPEQKTLLKEAALADEAERDKRGGRRRKSAHRRRTRRRKH